MTPSWPSSEKGCESARYVRSASIVTIIAPAKWSEELAKVVREHRRLFGSWKMPPCGELVPPRDVEMALRERSRCGRHADALVREHCDPGWDLDAVLLEEWRRPSHRVIRLERGVGRSGHPVNGERREDPLERKSTDRPTSTVAPRPVLLEEPRSEADRRVRQGISERPRFGALDIHVRTFGGPPLCLESNVLSLLGRWRPRRRRHSEGRQVDSDETFWMLAGESCGDASADVGAVSAEPLIPETFDDKSRPPICNVGIDEVRSRGHLREPIAWKRRSDDIERVLGISPVRRGIGEERNERRVLPERARPAVGEDNRERSRPLSPLVYRMDLFAVHRDSDVVELVEALRTRLYVELAPGGNDFAQRLRIRSGVLRHPVLRRGPSCLEEPSPQLRG